MASSINWSSTPASTSPSAIPPVYSSQNFRTPVEYPSPYAAATLYPSPQPLSADTDPVQLPSSIGPSRTKQSSTGIVTRRKAAQIAMQSSHSRENSGPFPSAVHTNGHPSQVSFILMTGFQVPPSQFTLPPLSLANWSLRPSLRFSLQFPKRLPSSCQLISTAPVRLATFEPSSRDDDGIAAQRRLFSVSSHARIHVPLFTLQLF